MTDEELMAVWRRWWLTISVPQALGPVEHADAELRSLLAHLEDYGFAIVRRMDPDLPG